MFSGKDNSQLYVSLITNVSAAHWQGFGSLHGVIEAKTAIYREANGIIIVNNLINKLNRYK